MTKTNNTQKCVNTAFIKVLFLLPNNNMQFVHKPEMESIS